MKVLKNRLDFGNGALAKVTAGAHAADRTYTIPDAGADANFVMSRSGVPAAGGFSVSPRNIHTGASKPMATTDGTDYTVVATEVLIGEAYVDANCTITGIALFNGSAVAGNVKVGLADSAGNIVATSASTAQVGTDAYQLIPFTAPYAAKGPATYYVVVIGDTGGGTSKINTHTVGSFGADKQTGATYATGFTAVTPPTTFTTGRAPIASLY